ncbi:MAG: hypothetical protein WCV81_03505 [Microgenomates group bacterium]|jgi:hypothetical protein
MDGESKEVGQDMRETEANQNIAVDNTQISTEAKKPTTKSTTVRGFDPVGAAVALWTAVSSVFGGANIANTPVNYNPELGPPVATPTARAQDTKITGVDVTETQKHIDTQMRENRAREDRDIKSANEKIDKFHEQVAEHQKKTGYTGEPTATPTSTPTPTPTPEE